MLMNFSGVLRPFLVGNDVDWRPFYGNVTEAFLPNVPKPLGKEVELRKFVDSDHAGDKASGGSRTGFMIYINVALINKVVPGAPVQIMV